MNARLHAVVRRYARPPIVVGRNAGYRRWTMIAPGISAAVVASVLLVAIPAHATDTTATGAVIADARNGLDAGSLGAAEREHDDVTFPVEPDTAQPAESVGAEARVYEDSDWLAAPPDPARHNLWVPTAEWATALALTIPLFMIDPSFVNVDPISAQNFVDAWSNPPVWDTDGVVANYVLHPIMGAEAYLTVRNRGYGPIESFLFSTGVSFAWEYLFEAWVEQPSGQDLLTTSPIGSLQGELRFQLRRRIAQWSPSLGRNTLLVLVDPVEALHRYIGKEFFDYPSDGAEEAIGSTLNLDPQHAGVMITLRF